MSYDRLVPPTTGEHITFRDGTLHVPDNPIIPFIEGDGTGPDIWASRGRSPHPLEVVFGVSTWLCARSSISMCAFVRCATSPVCRLPYENRS